MNKELMRRIYEVLDAFEQYGNRDYIPRNNTVLATDNKTKPISWEDLLKDDDKDGSGGGGGGTIRGLRGKDSVNAIKAAAANIKRLGRR